jgi:pyrroloquinoline quinone (PQQ) biosynthesis protein C
MTTLAPAPPASHAPTPGHALGQSLHIELGDTRDRLVHHRLYPLVNSPERLCRFMEMHVYAVWDFQSLLKAMQQRLTCTGIPWLPTADREARRLVNEIVLDEESDELPEGGHASHFELYLESMQLAGADTRPIERLLDVLSDGVSLEEAMARAETPAPAADFMRRSFEIIQSDSTHRIVAAFTYGREDVIPDMFRNFVGMLAEQDPNAWGRFLFYVERHISHDDAKHAPICRRIVANLCGTDPTNWAEASKTARQCLEARIALWNAIADQFS